MISLETKVKKAISRKIFMAGYYLKIYETNKFVLQSASCESHELFGTMDYLVRVRGNKRIYKM